MLIDKILFPFLPIIAAAILPERPHPTTPMPSMTIENMQNNEKAIVIKTTEREVVNNGLYCIVETSFVFSNPNSRQLAAEFSFPIPEGATVCGYKLEINGEMVPGVVCEKEKARVAFENEQRRRVDPGLVEHVKGNVWKTRIFPLPPNGSRRAEVSYVAPVSNAKEGLSVSDCFNGYLYTATCTGIAETTKDVNAICAEFSDGWILWDASRSCKDKLAQSIELLKTLPEKGNWQVVVFRDVPETPVNFTSREQLITALKAEPFDGGTDLAALMSAVPDDGKTKLVFTDEMDTLNEKIADIDERKDLKLVLRPQPSPRRISVERRKLRLGESPAIGEFGRLLAIAWAANRISDLSYQADARKAEFLQLGREFGVASPVTSLIVLERLEQWLEHKIEPPKELAIHAEWVKRRAAADDAIAKKMGNADFERRLLELWQERVLWWNNPKPKLETPKSGLFDNATTRVERVAMSARNGAIGQYRARRLSTSIEAESVEAEPVEAMAPRNEAMVVRSAVRMESAVGSRSFGKSKSSLGSQAVPSVAATVTLKAWDPKTSYIDAIKAAAKEEAYKVYLTESEQFGNSPAFYLDCAGWFFSVGEAKLAKRIISNLAEFKLEDSALWRVMGWRLREAKAYDESVRALRHLLALRGEEGQSYRDLALVLVERGKGRFVNGKLNDAAADIAEAMKMFHKCIFENHARRSARRSNDIQVAIIALEELNALIWWSAEQDWQSVKPPEPPEMDASYRRDLPMDLRIVLSWDADETDIDIHVLEPNCEEAYYRNRRTREGGFVGEDVTTGYGPEEYLAKTAQKGIFKVLCNYFASHQQSLTGPVSVTATVYTNWSRKDEKSQVLTLRLDKPKSKNIIGEIVID